MSTWKNAKNDFKTNGKAFRLEIRDASPNQMRSFKNKFAINSE